MSLDYRVIRIYTSEATRYLGKPLHHAVVQHVSGLRIAARCFVTRGIGGCYENGETATDKIEILSFNMPLKIEIILPVAELASVLPDIEKMVTDGIVSVEAMQVHSHSSGKSYIPSHLKVMDVMTRTPVTACEDTPVNEIIQTLLTSDFNGIPVVDGDGKPVGLITQGDLLTRADMPVRTGLLAGLDKHRIVSFLDNLPPKRATEVMTRPVFLIHQDKYLAEAVAEMLKHACKRLPVVDDSGCLIGMLARLDVFRAISAEMPRWEKLAQHKVNVTNPSLIRDVMRTDVRIVRPETPIDTVIRELDANDVQRVVVVDSAGRFEGIISDRDLFAALGEGHESLWDIVLSKVKVGWLPDDSSKRSHGATAADIMNRDVFFVHDDTPVDTAVQLMIDHKLKRLPVLDASGGFMGLVSRDSLLRTLIKA